MLLPDYQNFSIVQYMVLEMLRASDHHVVT